MSSVVEVILDKAFDGFCDDINNLGNNLNLATDLKLTKDSIRLIISRVEIILNTYIDPRLIDGVFTIGDFRKIVNQTYTERFN